MTPRRLPRAAPGVRPVRLVIAEAGAYVSSSHLLPDGDDGRDAVVVRQPDGEPPAELVQRVIARVAVLERTGSAVQRAVMLVAPRSDEQSMAARHLLARAVLTHAQVAAVESAELILSVSRDADAPLRHELLALVELLVGAPEGAAVPIRVQFDSAEELPPRPPRKSGLFARSRPDDETERTTHAPNAQTIPLDFRRRTMASR